MRQTLAFDVYGTLIDTSGIYKILERIIGQETLAFMEVWRNKQLEYSFRRGLMGAFVDFSVVTREALQYSFLLFNRKLDAHQIQILMDAYKVLPAFDDVETAVQDLQLEDYAKYAFSNGSAQAVSTLMKNANITDLFDGIVSVEQTKMFKPSPIVYKHFNECTASKKGNSWLISGNSFDVIGAVSYGMKAVWVKRSEGAIFDPWGIQPTAVISSLADLKSIL